MTTSYLLLRNITHYWGILYRTQFNNYDIQFYTVQNLVYKNVSSQSFETGEYSIMSCNINVEEPMY